MRTANKKRRGKKTARHTGDRSPTHTLENYQVLCGSLAMTVTVRLHLSDHKEPRAIDAYVDGTDFEPDTPGVDWDTPPNRQPGRLYASDPVAARAWLRKNAALIFSED